MNGMPRVGMLHGLFTLDGSLSCPWLFAQISRALAGSFEVEELPAHVAFLPARSRRAHLKRFLARQDAAVVPSVISVRHLVETLQARPRPEFPIVVVPVGELPRGAPVLRRALRHLGSRDTIVVLCRADVEIASLLVDEMKPRLLRLPCGIETDRFRPLLAEERRAARARLGLSASDVALLYAGRVAAEKNVHAAVSMFQQLAADDPRLRLLVHGPRRDERFREFGTGPFRYGSLLDRQVASDPRSAARITFFSGPPVPRGDLPVIFGAADIFVNLTLSHDESFGLSVVEAMSCQVPVVCSAWGGQKDTVVDGVTGFHAPAIPSGTGFAVDLWRAATACRTLADDPELRQTLGKAGRQRCLALYSLEAFRRGWEGVVREALSRRAKGRRNRLSEFGRLFHETFSAPAAAAERRLYRETRISTWPLYGDEKTRALYRRLLAPFGSRPAGRLVRDEDVLFLRSPFTRIGHRTVRVDDPLWPGAVPVTVPQAGLVVADLASGFSRAGELRGRHGLSRPAFDRLLEPLLRNGVVVRSRG